MTTLFPVYEVQHVHFQPQSKYQEAEIKLRPLHFHQKSDQPQLEEGATIQVGSTHSAKKIEKLWNN